MSAAGTVSPAGIASAADSVNAGRPRFPRALRPGDTVAVMAPSSGVRPAMHERLDAALALLRAKGFEVREGRSLRRQEQGASASGPERAAELMAALLDPTVAAVIPPWGGELAIEVLEHLDFDRLREAPPKWFSGFSDLSTIQLPLLVRAGWASLHGPNLMQLADPALDAVSARIFDAWASGAGAELAQPQAPGTLVRALDDRAGPVTIEGRMLGGCLDSVSRLAGTPFGDIRAFRSPAAPASGRSCSSRWPSCRPSSWRGHCMACGWRVGSRMRRAWSWGAARCRRRPRRPVTSPSATRCGAGSAA